MHKTFQLCGIGTALVDILLEVSDKEFSQFGLERSSSRLVTSEVQTDILNQLGRHKISLVAGGSVANSMAAFGQLGSRGALICCLGLDDMGGRYRKDMEALGISLPVKPVAGGDTGTVVVLVTPDAERTMQTCLGVGAKLNSSHVEPAVIKDSEWLFIEGYLFANGDDAVSAVEFAALTAKDAGTKVALTLSEAWVVQNHRSALEMVLPLCDLVFANEQESRAYFDVDDTLQSFELMQSKVPAVFVTAGRSGAYVKYEGVTAHVPAFPCEPEDLTGAGDMFAGTVLYGVINRVPMEKTVRAANFLAGKVICQVGARLKTGVREGWAEALNS